MVIRVYVCLYKACAEVNYFLRKSNYICAWLFVTECMMLGYLKLCMSYFECILLSSNYIYQLLLSVQHW